MVCSVFLKGTQFNVGSGRLVMYGFLNDVFIPGSGGGKGTSTIHYDALTA